MKHTKKRVAALLLTLAMVLSLMPMAFAEDDAAGFPDMPAEEDASYAAVKSAVDNGLLTGEDGKLNLEGSMTRATMAAVITRAFGAKGEADMSAFSDADGHWATKSGELPAAVAMGIMNGSNGKMLPNDQVTLEQVITMLVRALGLPLGTADDLKDVAGADSVTAWAVPYVAALLKAGYDVPDLTGAAQPLSRVEFTEMMYQVSGGNYASEGEITEDVDGNIIITGPVSLKGITVKGDIIIADGVDADSIVLDNVKVEGRLVVRGGSDVSLTNGTTAASTVVAAPAGELTVKADDASDAGEIAITGTDSKAAEKVTVDMAEPKVTVEAGTTLAVQNAKGGEVTLKGDGAKVAVESGTVASVTVADGVKDVAVDVAADATIEKVTTNTDLAITGEGTVTEKAGSGTVTDAEGNEVEGTDEPAEVPTVTTPSTPDEVDPNKPTNPVHTHSWDKVEQFSATQHKRICAAAAAAGGVAGQAAGGGEDGDGDGDEPPATPDNKYCGATTYENHTFDEENVCTACSFKKPGSKTESEATPGNGACSGEHVWANINDESNTAATCAAPGGQKQQCTNMVEPAENEDGTRAAATRCTATRTVTTAALGHDMKVTGSENASCDEDGAIHYACTRTGCDVTDDVTIPATEKHNWKQTNTVLPTCTEDGKYVYTCSTCTGETAQTKEVPITKLGHSFSTAWEKDGANHWHKCVRSGCDVKDGQAAHDYGEEEGNTVCTVCGYDKSAGGTTTPTGPQGAHTWVNGKCTKTSEGHGADICTCPNADKHPDVSTIDKGEDACATCHLKGTKEPQTNPPVEENS